MMDTNDAIKFLKGMQGPLQDYADMVGAPGFAKGIRYVYPDPEDYAIEAAISALEEQDKHRWISVEERLPEDDGYIILSFENFSLPMVGKYTSYYGGGGEFYVCNRDNENTCFSQDLRVIAWMPLPAPYQEEGKNR